MMKEVRMSDNEGAGDNEREKKIKREARIGNKEGSKDS